MYCNEMLEDTLMKKGERSLFYFIKTLAGVKIKVRLFILKISWLYEQRIEKIQLNTNPFHNKVISSWRICAKLYLNSKTIYFSNVFI